MTLGAETLFEELKRYVRFGDRESRLLAELRPHAAPVLEDVAERFYERTREHEAAHEVFKDEAQVERLKRSLVRWMDRLLTGPHDEAYFHESAKIGRMHVRIGLPQRYMLTAMSLVRSELGAVARDALGDRATEVQDALCRALDLELAVMLETYKDASIELIQSVERIERAEVDRALARTEHRYRSAVELARVLVIGVDEEGKILLFNREAERTTGFDRYEVIGKSFVDTLLAEELRAEHGPRFSAAARGESVPDEAIDAAVVTRAGKLRDVRLQLAYAPLSAQRGPPSLPPSSPSNGGGGNEREVVLFIIGPDTTEEQLLAARVRKSEKLAAVGTLAAGLAHEIRNPLNGARLNLIFLERGLKRMGNDPDLLDAVGTVSDEILRLSALVTDFLDFARPKPIEPATMSVRALFERAESLVRADAEAAGSRVVIDLPASDLSIVADAHKLEQVLLNLLKNAIEALASSGGGKVVMRARRSPRKIAIEVEDEGPGLVSPEAPIFDPFFSTKPRGTGLGLSIVHRIVSDHDGVIDVDSRPGRTVFRMTLPIEPTPMPERAHRS